MKLFALCFVACAHAFGPALKFGRTAEDVVATGCDKEDCGEPLVLNEMVSKGMLAKAKNASLVHG